MRYCGSDFKPGGCREHVSDQHPERTRRGLELFPSRWEQGHAAGTGVVYGGWILQSFDLCGQAEFSVLVIIIDINAEYCIYLPNLMAQNQAKGTPRFVEHRLGCGLGKGHAQNEIRRKGPR